MKPIAVARLSLDQHNAQRGLLIEQVRAIAPNVSVEHVGDVFDALWLLDKLEFNS